MDTIGLIAAMKQESNALLRYIKDWKRAELGKFDCKAFKVGEHRCLLVTSGMGSRWASEATSALVEAYVPKILISFGIAGAVQPDLEIGDVVVSEAWCRLSDGVLGSNSPLASWPGIVMKSAAFSASSRRVHLVTGTAVTSDGSLLPEAQLNEFKHPILEMETAGIAQMAAANGIPLLSLRAISDGPRAPIPFNLGEIMDEDANYRPGAMFKAIIRHPGILLESRRMISNSRIAADNAAYALVSALGSKDF